MEHKFIKNRDIVLFSFQPWDTEIGSNFKDIARELSKYNRVLYVNRALDRVSMIRNKTSTQVQHRLASVRNGIDELVEVHNCLWIQNPRTILASINWIPFSFLHDQLNWINNKRLARQINLAIDRLKFSDVILINDNDFIRGRYLKELVNCKDYIFYKRDYLLGVGYFQRHGPRLEAATLRNADLVVTNSSYLEMLSKKYNSNSFDIGQGCDFTNFQSVKFFLPDDLTNIQHPIIGYAGFVSAWRIDMDIIKYIATTLPGCNIVMIGPVDELLDLDEMREFSNIHFLGYKTPEQLPQYLQHFDVCINPQVRNEITMGNYPRKIDEYLVMGKPVVATFTEAMKMFETYTWLCNTKQDFVTNITNILKHTDEDVQTQIAGRIDFALTHTWEASIGRLGDAYYQTIGTGKRNEQQVIRNSSNRLKLISIILLIAYLLFIFIKFLFF